jgi:hypothetical protein
MTPDRSDSNRCLSSGVQFALRNRGWDFAFAALRSAVTVFELREMVSHPAWFARGMKGLRSVSVRSRWSSYRYQPGHVSACLGELAAARVEVASAITERLTS